MQIYNSEKWRRHELYSTQLRFWAAFHFARTWSRCTIRYKTNAMTSHPVRLWRTVHRYNASQRVSKLFGVRVQTLPPLQTTTTTVANVICCRWCHLWRCLWMQWDGFIFAQVSNMLCVCLRYCRKWKKTFILFSTTRNKTKILSNVSLQSFIYTCNINFTTENVYEVITVTSDLEWAETTSDVYLTLVDVDGNQCLSRLLANANGDAIMQIAR